MSQKELLSWILSHQLNQIKPGLARITKFLKYLGNPHKKLKTIHIAGTNGKGSTTVILSALLKNHGLKVGTYTSPHLFKLNERFKINGKDISDEELFHYLRIIKKIFDKIPATYFELTTALSFLYFFKNKVDIAVIECGMGGRLDATNVIKPEVCIITNIGWDHAKYLGNTLEKIAFEKACIIKRNIPCVLGNIKSELIKVFKKRAELLNSPLYILGKKFYIELKNEKWNYFSKKTFLNLELSLKGFFQGPNLACALKTLEILEEKNWLKIEEEKVKNSLKNIKWKGRYEKININNKKILIDCAHNIDGIRALKESLIKDSFYPVFTLIGVTNEGEDKPLLDFLKELENISQKIYICEFNSPRKIATIEDWKRIVNRKNFKILEFFKNPQMALNNVLNSSIQKILITGSIYFVAECLKILKNE